MLINEQRLDTPDVPDAGQQVADGATLSPGSPVPVSAGQGVQWVREPLRVMVDGEPTDPQQPLLRYVGQTSPVLCVQIVQADGSPLDITGAVRAQLALKPVYGGASLGGAMQIWFAATALLLYGFTPSDVSAAGDYYLMVQVTRADGGVLIAPTYPVVYRIV